MYERVWQTQSFIAFVLRGTVVHKTARALDENDLIANHTVFLVQQVRERSFFVKDVRYLAKMVFTETRLHNETPRTFGCLTLANPLSANIQQPIHKFLQRLRVAIGINADQMMYVIEQRQSKFTMGRHGTWFRTYPFHHTHRCIIKTPTPKKFQTHLQRL